MAQREIPGFYFGKLLFIYMSRFCPVSIQVKTLFGKHRSDEWMTDAEKGKYFRVQANHVAPQGAKYSHENVKKEKEISRVSFVSLFPLSDGERRSDMILELMERWHWTTGYCWI
jgi:hypothetical protein